jgi:hypothetical protein
MRSTPGSIKEEVMVDLDRPRLPDVMLTEQYIKVRKKVLAAIRQESLKSFNHQSH